MFVLTSPPLNFPVFFGLNRSPSLGIFFGPSAIAFLVLFQLYEELGSQRKVAEKMGIGLASVNRLLKSVPVNGDNVTQNRDTRGNNFRYAVERLRRAGELYGRGGKLPAILPEAIRSDSRDQLGEMFGVGGKLIDAAQYLKDNLGEKAVAILLEVNPDNTPGGDKKSEEYQNHLDPVSEWSGKQVTKTEQRNKAIARAPEPIKELYLQGCIGHQRRSGDYCNKLMQ